MKKLALLLMIITIVFLAGCIGQKEEKITGVATGVIIKSFAPDISEVFSGDPVTLSLSVENVGEEDAKDIRATLFGLGTDWGGESGQKPVADFLQKSQPQYKIPGGVGDVQWDVTSPSGLKVDNTYTAGVRVVYGYKTTAIGTIKVYNSDYLRARPEEAEKILKSSGIASFSVTKAPITVSLLGVARPLIYRPPAQNATVTIQISDIGQGDPYNTTPGDMNVTIDDVTVNKERCKDQTFPQTVKLPRVGAKSISCKFTLPEVSEYTTIPVEVALSYRYFVDGSTSIKVLKVIE
jgi:hypothetical protein